jgi:hypothetical protein
VLFLHFNQFGSFDLGITSTSQRNEYEQIFNQTFIDEFQYEWFVSGEPEDIVIHRIDAAIWLGNSNVFWITFFEDSHFQ